MHQALILIACAIALAHDHWRRSVGRRLSLSGHIAVLQERERSRRFASGVQGRAAVES